MHSLPLRWEGERGGFAEVTMDSGGTDGVWRLLEPRLDRILDCYQTHGRVAVRVRGCVREESHLPWCGPGFLRTNIEFHYQSLVDQVIYEYVSPNARHPVDSDFLDTDDHEPFWTCVQDVLDELAHNESLDARLNKAAPVRMRLYESREESTQDGGSGTIPALKKGRR